MVDLFGWLTAKVSDNRDKGAIHDYVQFFVHVDDLNIFTIYDNSSSGIDKPGRGSH